MHYSVERTADPIMHDMPVVLNFAIDGVWINYLIDFGDRFSDTFSVSSFA